MGLVQCGILCFLLEIYIKTQKNINLNKNNANLVTTFFITLENKWGGKEKCENDMRYLGGVWERSKLGNIFFTAPNCMRVAVKMYSILSLLSPHTVRK